MMRALVVCVMPCGRREREREGECVPGVLLSQFRLLPLLRLLPFDSLACVLQLHDASVDVRRMSLML